MLMGEPWGNRLQLNLPGQGREAKWLMDPSQCGAAPIFSP